jgi:hypothetical protein
MIQTLLITLFLVLSACGKKENDVKGSITNVSLSKGLESNQEVLFMEADVGNSQVLFKDDILTIQDPTSGQTLGSVLMLREGKINRLSVKLDITKAKLAASLADLRLPNGGQLPVEGFETLQAFPAGENSKVYLGQKQNQYMLGLALAVEQFNNLSGPIPGASFFFKLDSNNGLGGYFTALEPNKSGVALLTETAGKKQMNFREKSATFEQAQYFGFFVEKWKKSKTLLKIK